MINLSIPSEEQAPVPPDDFVNLTMREFDALPEYSCTIPTGTTIGKQWKRRWPYRTDDPRPPVWHLGEYAVSKKPGMVDIIWREIFITPPMKPTDAGG